MLITLVSILLITLVCYGWGLLFFGRPNESPTGTLSHPAIVSLAGLMMVSMTATLVSLFFPLGTIWIKLAFVAPAVFAFLRSGPRLIWNPFFNLFKEFSPGAWFLLLGLVAMLLILSASPIIHPDTLGYHAPIIRWMEEYRIVPGLAHLQPRLGLQNSWFVSIALFDFLPQGKGILFLPVAVLCWYFLFVVDKIQSSWRKMSGQAFWGWISWLIISLLPVTMVRLTAMSSHPDFIAVLVCWVVFLLMMNLKEEDKFRAYTLVFLFSVYAITIKFSVLPILLIGAYAKWKLIQLGIKKALIPIGLAFFLLTGTLARQYISSGYPLYPSTLLNIGKPDWKVDESRLTAMSQYVTGYARGYHVENYEAVISGSKTGIMDWLPRWWGYLSAGDKIVLVLALIGLFIIAYRLVKKQYSFKMRWLLFANFTGLLFWMIKAPDPRFGYAFITGLILMAWWENKLIINLKWQGVIVGLAPWLLGLSFCYYSFLRFENGEVQHQIILPGGPPIEKIFTVIQKDNKEIYRPGNNNFCGWSLLPCTPDSVDSWEFRGKELQDGFRAKNVQ